MSDRRTFLHGLVTLPLIGGGVAILGQPTAVAEPVTLRLATEYAAWLGIEHDRICHELRGRDYRSLQAARWYDGTAYDWHTSSKRPSDDLWGFNSPAASSRAALVLSTVGVDWRTPNAS